MKPEDTYKYYIGLDTRIISGERDQSGASWFLDLSLNQLVIDSSLIGHG